MKIGIIGAGQIGGTLTRLLSRAGHEVFVANSRGPQTLAELAAETGAKAVTAREAAHAGSIVVVTIQQGRVHELAKDLFDGASDDVVIVDTNNYYPRERDGRIDGIEQGMLESRWVEQQLGRSVVKAFNNINWVPLLNEGKPKGATGRIALPVAGDDAKAKAIVIGLIDEIGFDGVDAGPLDESWRQQPDTPVYGTNLDAERLKQALQQASPEREPKWRATPNSPGNFETPA